MTAIDTKCVGLHYALIGVLLAVLVPVTVPAASPDRASEVLTAAGVRQGLCLHLGCGQKSSPHLTAGLAADSEMLVHGLALDDASAERARRAVSDAGLAGRASVEKIAMDPLPYVSDAANLVVIEDPASLTAAGVKDEEVWRVLAPGGTLCARKDGKWSATIKERPKEMDTWSHPQHGPDGNFVSQDKLVGFPVGVRWLDGLPMNFGGWAANRAWVISRNRCFILGSTVYENLAPAPTGRHKQNCWLTARDAFNGLPAWRIECGINSVGDALNLHNSFPLATDDKRVYFIHSTNTLAAVDAATGKRVMTYPVKYRPVRLALSKGVLVCGTWEAMDYKTLWGEWNVGAPNGVLYAFDAETGKQKWTVEKPAQQMLIDGDVVYAMFQTPISNRTQEISAFDLATGRQLWNIPPTQFVAKAAVEILWNGYKPNLELTCTGNGVLVVARHDANTISIVSREKGTVLWEINKVEQTWPEKSYWSFLVDGLLWYKGQRFDPRTGEVKGLLPWHVGSGECTPASIVNNIYCTSRQGAYFQFTLSDKPGDKGSAKHITYGGTRGGCLEGATPANGMFYTAQNNCACAVGQFPGFAAFGPCGTLPGSNEVSAIRPLEKGPAYGKLDAVARKADEWPMFLHDAERSAATSSKIPKKLKILWQEQLAREPDGPLAVARKERLYSCLTPPVVAGNKVFAAALHSGEVQAVDVGTGKIVWKACVNARVDSPPTIHGDTCAVGSHDGWLYALSAADGQLAWRTRVAPREKRMVAYGQVESVWPVIGSALVLDSGVYASAGRTAHSDGGVSVASFDIRTGAQKWATQFTRGGRQNDLLVAGPGSKISIHQVELSVETGAFQPPSSNKVNRIVGLEGLIDSNWARMLNRRSGEHSVGSARGEMITWSDAMVFAFHANYRHCYALDRDTAFKAKNSDPHTRKDFAWKLFFPEGRLPVAMIRADETLVLAGCEYDGKSARAGGFLWLVNCADGKKVFELQLDAPPVCNGLAAAGGHVYLSLQDGRLLRMGNAD